MNKAMLQLLLADPAALERAAKSYENKLQAEKRAREDFSKSDMFQRMLVSLRDNPTPQSVDSNELSYFADRVKIRVGWEYASEADIDIFFSIVSQASDETVTPGSEKEDDDCAFDNCSFEQFGLRIFKMYGQGTFVRISNMTTSDAS